MATAKKNLKDWLHWIEKLHPKEMDLGLERVKAVADRLGVLNTDSFVITVGGTNGKGSCVATIESILLEAGLSVGAYFSPHLLKYNERFRVNTQYVADEPLVKAFLAINDARRDISLTYFEWSTLAALWLFKREKLDVFVLEVGLGGRLDAVNILDPDISVITTIDLDHTEWLGKDRESIAREKAGIFRQGKPVICGDPGVPEAIKTAAMQLGAPLYCQGRDFGYREGGQESWEFWVNSCHSGHDPRFDRDKLAKDAPQDDSANYRNDITVEWIFPKPYFLLQNVATALMTVVLFRESLEQASDAHQKKMTEKTLSNGIKKAFLPGRFQIIAQNPQIILDVAHNPQSCRELYFRLKSASSFKGKIYAVVGMMNDKDHYESLKALSTIVDDWLVADLDTQRGYSGIKLLETLHQLNASKVQSFLSITQAYQVALNRAKINDIIVVFGSFYAVAPILEVE